MAQRKRNKIENIIILSGFGALALFMIIFTFLMVTPIFTIDKYEDMKEIKYADILTQKKEQYYVFFIDEKNDDCQELETAITHYAEHARTSGAPKAYIVYTNKRENSDNTYKAPTLIYVSDGKVSETLKTYSSIINKLNDLMN